MIRSSENSHGTLDQQEQNIFSFTLFACLLLLLFIILILFKENPQPQHLLTPHLGQLVCLKPVTFTCQNKPRPLWSSMVNEEETSNSRKSRLACQLDGISLHSQLASLQISKVHFKMILGLGRVKYSVNQNYPSARAPDHCSKNPKMAEIKIAEVLFRFQLNARIPGGSSRGIKAMKKNTVIGVVFHINLYQEK